MAQFFPPLNPVIKNTYTNRYIDTYLEEDTTCMPRTDTDIWILMPGAQNRGS